MLRWKADFILFLHSYDQKPNTEEIFKCIYAFIVDIKIKSIFRPSICNQCTYVTIVNQPPHIVLIDIFNEDIFEIGEIKKIS